MKDDLIEQRKRFDMVLGIFLAAVLGFVVNLLAMAYYDLFVTHKMSWASIDHGQVYGLGVIVFGLVGFLDFFIADYKNDVEVTRSFIRRFINHFFYKFVAGRIIRFFEGLYLLLFALAVFIGIFIMIGQVINYFVAVLFALFIIALGYNRHKDQNNIQ